MSTFGKKALNSWNYKYSKENSLRFNHTPMDLQLEILKKWYPIGMECVKFNLYFKNYDHFKYQIVGYEEIIGGFYNLELVKFIFTNSSKLINLKIGVNTNSLLIICC
jgi:hypothetical protein